MKYILAFLLLFVATFAQAQAPAVPQASLVASSLSQLTGYTGSLVQANWTDTLRGGRFDLIYNSSITDDNGIYFAATAKGAGYHWRRDISQAEAIFVTWFGAIPDSITICNSAINLAFQAAQALNITRVIFPVGKAYIITNTVQFPANISVFMDAPIYYRGAGDRPAVIVGDSTIRTVNENYRLSVQSETISDWTDENNVGLELVNLSQCNSIDITQAIGFTIGVQCLGVGGQGFVYDNVYFGVIRDNKIAIDLKRGGGLGWVNECNFYGGRIAVQSTTHPGESRYGVRISSVDAGNSNNNNFYKPSFELRGLQAMPGIALPILLENATQCKFIDCRDEGNYSDINSIVVQSSGTSTSNTVNLGFTNNATPTTNDVGTYPSTILTTRLYGDGDRNTNTFYSSGNLTKRITPYNAASFWFPDELNVYSSSGVFSSANLITWTPAYLGMVTNRGIGVRVETNAAKKFIVKRNTIQGYPGRVIIVCYDSAGNVLNGADSMYAAGSFINQLAVSNSFGGGYSSASDYNRSLYFRVKDTVSYIDVIMTGGTDSLKLKAFTIESVEGKASIMRLKTNTGSYAQIAPTIGTWDAGTLLLHPLPTTNMGFLCTVSGTPGTWVSVPVPAALTAVIQNQNSAAQGANFWISGTGQAATLTATTGRIGGGTTQTLPNNSGISLSPQLSNYQSANVAIIGVGVTDGARNRRLGLYVDDTSAVKSYGITTSFSSDNRAFNIRDATNVFETKLQNGRTGLFNVTTPSAWLHLPAGTASSGFAPLKFSAGIIAITPEAGAMETDASNELYYSSSTTTASRGYVHVDRYVAKTATYTITANDGTINCTSGTFTVTLPTAVGIAGREYTITNSGSGTITIATTSSQTFVNITSTPTTLTLAPVGAAAIVSYTAESNGSNWLITRKVKNE